MRENEGELEGARRGFGVTPVVHERTGGESEGAEGEHCGCGCGKKERVLPTALLLSRRATFRCN